jgi:hypothetical protein
VLRLALLPARPARHAVSIAIVDDVDSFVIGGPRAGLEAACQEAAARGARRTVRLPVAVPSHTPLLHEATEQFCGVLRAASPRLPRAGYRLLGGIDGDTIHDIETGSTSWPVRSRPRSTGRPASRAADQPGRRQLWNSAPEAR